MGGICAYTLCIYGVGWDVYRVVRESEAGSGVLAGHCLEWKAGRGRQMERGVQARRESLVVEE